MNFRLIFLIIFFNFSIFINAQDSRILFSVDNNNVSLGEFKSAFTKKYGQDKMSDKKTLNNFLQEYINFKLKVEEAKALRLDKKKSIQKKVDDFSQIIVQSYIVNKQLIEPFAREAYRRMQTEIELQHILFKVSEYALPKDTLLAYQKAMTVRKLLVDGANFTEIATQVSDAPLIATNKGNMGYVSAFSLPYDVENYVYNSNSSSYSFPIRSHKGYHIVKILNKRKNPGYFKVAHILIKNDIDTSKIYDINTKRKIDKVYTQYINGENFNILAQTYSNDISISKKYQALPWLTTGLMPEEFEKTCIELQNKTVSQPIKTRFGWHIIKKIEHQELPEYSLIKEQLEQIILKSQRGRVIRTNIIGKLKTKYKYTDYQKLNPIAKLVDSTIFKAKWIPNEYDIFTDKICEINNNAYTQKEFIKYLQDNQKYSYPIPIPTYVNVKYNAFIDSILLNNELNYLKNNNKEIANIIKNYQEMILANKLTEIKSNSDINISESELRKFYNDNSETYNQDYQVDISIFSYTDNIKKIEKQFRKLKKRYASNQEIEAKIKAAADMKFKFDEKITANKGQNFYADHIIDLFLKGKLEYDDKLIIFAAQNKLVWIDTHIRKTNKSFEEVKQKLSNDYKIKNKNKWITHIKRKHNVKVDEDILSTLR